MPPMGLMYLASSLRKVGDFDIKIIDMEPAKMAYENIGKEIRDYQPSWLGISALTNESNGLHKLAAIAKEVNPDLPVVVGGPHPSAYTEQVMNDQNINYAVLGEGEITVVELDRAIRTQSAVDSIDGLAWRDNGLVRINPRQHYSDDLDAMPFPAWDLIDISKFRKIYRMSNYGHSDYMPIFPTRACPFKCIYCHNMFGKGFRMRSPENVLAELRILYEKHNIREFEFIDDIFNCDLPRAKRIFDLIIESGMKITFTFPNGIRGDHADEEFFAKARQAGAIFMSFAIETATPRLQKMLLKNINLEKIRQNIVLARKHKIFCLGFFMLGFPTETREELQATVDFAVNSALNAAHFFIVYPFQGTELANMAQAMGKPISVDFDNNYVSAGFTNLTNLPDKDLDRIRRRAVLQFWLKKPWRIWAIVRDHPFKWQLPVLAYVFVKRLLIGRVT